jgi:hypothetical protein
MTSQLLELSPAKRRYIAEEVCKRIELDLTSPEFTEALFSQHREQINTGGVRSGKTTAGAAWLFYDAQIKILLGQPALYWIIGPDYPQTKQAFRYLKQWAIKTGDYVNSSEPQDGPQMLEMTRGIRIETKSAVYHERLGSVAPDGILVDEAGQCSDEIRRICQERSMEKSARILYTSTLENEFDKPQYAWFTELAAEWEQDRSLAHGSYRLPSWINHTIYGSCLQAIKTDPSLEEFCPDDNHGPSHSGYIHPEIQRAKAGLVPYIFSIRIAGEPAGLPFVVYPQLENESRYLRPFDSGPKLSAYGGIDFGSVHPSVLSVVTFHPRIGAYLPGQLRDMGWVREVRIKRDDPSDVNWIRQTKHDLSVKWQIPNQNWRTDPNEKFMARTYSATAVSGSAGSRDYRIGLFVARLNDDAIAYDVNGPGVRAAYEEAKQIRRVKQRNGEMVLRRIDDDMQASIEDAVEGRDGLIHREFPKPLQRRYRQHGRKRELKSV